jgi:hypothetical protein
MELLKLEDAVFTPEDVIFRESRVVNLIFGLIMLGLPVGMIYMAIFHETPDCFTYFIGIPVVIIFVAVGLLIMKSAVRAFYAANWLLAINDERILIKFRSFANCHFKNTDPQVVAIPLIEIQSIRPVKERRVCLDGPDNAPQGASGTYVEIFLNGNISNAEIEKLKERFRRSEVSGRGRQPLIIRYRCRRIK